MGFFSNQLRSVIEWKDPNPEVMIWRWDGANDELKNASKLLVNPGQVAIFLYEGQVKAVHDYPGLFELATANLPFWTTISKIMQGFTSEHKANIFFVKMTEIMSQKWGTKAPIKYEDPKYKFPIGLRAFGNFSFRILDPRKFFTEYTSNVAMYTVSDIRSKLVDRILTPLTDLLAESNLSYIEIDKQRVELSQSLHKSLGDIFTAFGFELTDFRIESTDFDEDTKKRIDKIADKIADAQAIKALGDVDGSSMRNYAAVEQLKALNTAASNPGGTAGLGVNIGAGMAMGQGMVGAFQQNQPPAPPAAATFACPSCNAQMEERAKFCPSCGKPNARIAGAVCVACQKPMPAGNKFCPECGAPQSKSCPNCKAAIPGGTKFCPECGTKV